MASSADSWKVPDDAELEDLKRALWSNAEHIDATLGHDYWLQARGHASQES